MDALTIGFNVLSACSCADCVFASLGGRLTSVMAIAIGTAHFQNSTFQQLKPRGRKTGAITLDDRAELAVDSCTFDPNNGGSYVIGLYKSTKVCRPRQHYSVPALHMPPLPRTHTSIGGAGKGMCVRNSCPKSLVPKCVCMYKFCPAMFICEVLKGTRSLPWRMPPIHCCNPRS